VGKSRLDAGLFVDLHLPLAVAPTEFLASHAKSQACELFCSRTSPQGRNRKALPHVLRGP
jgi:hypothetical protein